MTEVIDARDAYLEARKQVTATRLALGKAVKQAREHGVDQVKIAKTLELTREQVRRYQAEYEDSITRA